MRVSFGPRARRESPSAIVARVIVSAALIGALACASKPVAAQFTQQGPKLVGAGVVGSEALQGISVAVSVDGNTAIMGGQYDNAFMGAAWVFTRSNGAWTQQGNKLVGAGAVGPGVLQGASVAISADGNTAIVGGYGDNNGVGAAWVFTRSNGVWIQQGGKLVGTGAVGPYPTVQGRFVALSADGNTVILGGPSDDLNVGAAWVFTRRDGAWTQQGNKLVGTGAAGSAAEQGTSVALSADGNTAIIGGPDDNLGVGAAWVFTRSNGVWTQQGNKLAGTGAVEPNAAQQGTSVALSADGNTAIVGGPRDNVTLGAVWVFTRSNGAWTQQGSKLVGIGTGPLLGLPNQGQSVALSADGNSAIIGGPGAIPVGGAWVFTRSKGAWTQQGYKLVGTAAVGQSYQGISVALSADGRTAIIGGPQDNVNVGAAWVFTALPKLRPNTHDFNGDGRSDIAWRDIRGNTAIWLMNGAAILSLGEIGVVPTSWSIVGQRDFDGDGKADLLWRDTGGNTAIWFMNGVQVASSASVGNLPTSWSVVGTGDFNGDGMGDILWRDASGNLVVWLMNGASSFHPAGSAACPRRGRSSAPATSTATARPIFCGATPAATRRSGS